MANAIDILIRAIWQGGSATEKAKRDLQGLGPAGKTGAGGLDEVAASSTTTASSLSTMAVRIGTAAAALGAVTVAARQAWRALEEGAGLELTAMRFDNLARSIGTTGDALRTDLLEATSGMLSNAQAMSLATDLIGLGLANTSDTAVRLARVVAELGADMNQLTLTLSNQTTMRFDTLGIAVAGFDEKLQDLKGTMSDEEAFLMAFLDQAEESIERAGGAAETTAGDMMRLAADWANLNDQIKITMALGFGDFLAAASGRNAKELEELAAQGIEAAESIAELEKAYAALAEQADELKSDDRAAFALFTEGAFDDARIEMARALALMVSDADEFESEMVRIFGPRGLADVIIASGEDSAETFYEMARVTDEHGDAMQRNDAIMRQQAQGVGELADEYDDLDAVLQRVNESLDQNARALAAIEPYESRREGIDSGDLASQQRQDQLAVDFELLQDRVDLFEDFQLDLTAITTREEEQRAQITEQYEERRTDLVEDYNRQRTEEEADWLRQRAKQAAQLERDIAGVRDDTAERQAELRDDANRRIAELEEDHLKRLEDIRRDSEIGISDAASMLDATAVNRLQRERDRALEEETEQYQDQRADIMEELDRRIEAERVAAEQRIAEMQEFHDRRQQEEAADREIRLQREQEAHQRQLDELDDTNTARLDKLTAAAATELATLEQKYTDEHGVLTAALDDRAALEKEKRDELLDAEKEWWNERIGLITGTSGGSTIPASVGGIPAQGGVALSISPGAITVNAAPGQSAEEVGGEVVSQIDGYFERLLGGRR